MLFNATFNNLLAISWRSVSLVEETGILGENHYIIFDLIFGVLTPLSTIFQLYQGDQF